MSSKILLCIFLEVNQDPVPRLHYCFLTAPPLSLHPFPSLISSCLNLPFGTQGRSWRLKSISKKWGTQGSMARSPTGSCLVLVLCWMLGISEQIYLQCLSLRSLQPSEGDKNWSKNQTNQCDVTTVIDTSMERTVFLQEYIMRGWKIWPGQRG